MVQDCSALVVGKQGFTGLQGQEGQGRRPLQATQRFILKTVVIDILGFENTEIKEVRLTSLNECSFSLNLVIE